MTTGKTNARYMRLYLNEFDASGDARQLSAAGQMHDISEVHGWSDGVKNFTLGPATRTLDGFQAVANKGGLWTNLTGDGTDDYVASLAIGIRAAPAVGDPAFLFDASESALTVDGTDGILLSLSYAQQVGASTLYANPWGNVVGVLENQASTINGTSVDNGASSANGLVAHLHLTATSGSWVLKIQDSPDDAAWGDVLTFSLNGSAVGAELATATGTIDRYIRFQATRTSGTLSAQAFVARQ